MYVDESSDKNKGSSESSSYENGLETSGRMIQGEDDMNIKELFEDHNAAQSNHLHPKKEENLKPV